MAEGNSTPVRAVAYYRRSTRHQKDSIENQRARVREHAARHGFDLAREYADDGVSGTETAKRREFLQMLRDAEGRGFDAILIDALDRFGRLDILDMGEVLAPLRRLGLRLVTVNRGELDLHSPGGRFLTTADAEAGNAEQASISRRVLGAMIAGAASRPMGARPPYGYRVEREEVHVPGRGPRLLPKRLVVEEREARVVRMCFAMAAEGEPLHVISAALADRGVRSPTGKDRWSRHALRKMLTNPKYTGDLVFNRRRTGKRFCAGPDGGGPVAVRDRKPGEQRNAHNVRAAWVVAGAAHEAIVDAETFRKAQAAIAGRATTPGAGKRPTFLLSGLMACGTCRSTMIGETERSGRRVYVCGRYREYGKGACSRNVVHEDRVLRGILRAIKRDLMADDALDTLRGRARERFARQRSDEARGRLRREAEEADALIRGAAEKIAILPASAAAELGKSIEAWARRRDAALADLNRLDTDNPVADVEALINAAVDWLWCLEEAAGVGDPAALGRLLRESVAGVELHFEARRTAVQTRGRLVKGVVNLKESGPDDVLGVLLTVSRGRTSAEFYPVDCSAA